MHVHGFAVCDLPEIVYKRYISLLEFLNQKKPAVVPSFVVVSLLRVEGDNRIPAIQSMIIQKKMTGMPS